VKVEDLFSADQKSSAYPIGNGGGSCCRLKAERRPILILRHKGTKAFHSPYTLHVFKFISDVYLEALLNGKHRLSHYLQSP
jgi:hypothetical protein